MRITSPCADACGRSCGLISMSWPAAPDSGEISGDAQLTGLSSAGQESDGSGQVPGGSGQMPGNMDMSDLPEGFDPENLPDMGNFDPENMPDMGNFDPNNMPNMGNFTPGSTNGGSQTTKNLITLGICLAIAVGALIFVSRWRRKR